jgi:glycopeptide antibiotics resistance protein
VEKKRHLRHLAIRWLGSRGRHQLRPWYFFALAFLMWAPLNGVGIPLDNYLLGLRMDHLLHASVFVPCGIFWMDFFRGRRRSWWTWLAAVGTGLLTEGGQYILPYRGFDVNDLIANFLGVSLGWAAILLLRRFKLNR